MYKVLILVLREYLTSVKTKGFIIGLVLAPILMTGALFVILLFEDRVDISEKKIYILDHTHAIGDAIIESAIWRNENQIYDTVKGKQVLPAYVFEILDVDSNNLMKQKLELSDMVRDKKIHAFVEIGPDVIRPQGDMERARVKYYSENSLMDDVPGWLTNPVNNRIKQLRIDDMGLDEQEIQDLFYWINISGMSLITAEALGSELQDASESNLLETFLVPYAFMILMFLMVMMSAVPLLNAVMEEKSERIAEVLLGTVKPFQFMMGKVLGGVSISLTGFAVYIIGGSFIVSRLGYAQYIPFGIITWFFVYMILAIIMFGSGMATLGSICNDSKDAQSLQFPAMLPILIPMFVIVPVIKEPMSTFSVALSLVPPFTPFLMLIRQASPVTIPLWQPMAGLAGIMLFALLTVWAGAKIFRTMILMQGKKPKLTTLVQYVLKK